MKHKGGGKVFSRKKKRLVLLAACLQAAVLTACGSTDSMKSTTATEAAAYDTGASYSVLADGTAYYADTVAENTEAETEYGYDGTAASEEDVEISEAALADRKLIKTVDISLETEDYDTLVPHIEAQVTALGGYIENLNTTKRVYGYSSDYETEYLRYTYMVVRMPKENLDTFLDDVGEQSNIINRSESVEDVTLQYVDLESHKNALLTEQERLMELMEQAETVEDLISIESRLSEVRYQLESMESQLRTYDNKIDYSTVYLSIDEVEKYTPTEKITVGERIRNGFTDSLWGVGNGIAEFAIWFVIHIPYLIVWAVVIAAAVFILCKLRKRILKRRAQKIAARVNTAYVQSGNPCDQISQQSPVQENRTEDGGQSDEGLNYQ